MASISVTINNPIKPGDVIIDSTTAFSVQADSSISTLCPSCAFAAPEDVIGGQTIEVRLQPNSTPPAAAELVLKQGAISGSINVVNETSFTLQSDSSLLQGVDIQVMTDSSTVLEGFSGSFAAQQKVIVRGFLFKGSGPGTAVLIAKHVELAQ